ncbi:MAG: hypothetical protein ABI766_03855 [Gemmatimonadales bacterium]
MTLSGLLAATLWLRLTGVAPLPPPPTPPPHSVAVVPFLNDSPDSSYDYLSEGIGGDIASTLGRIPGLRVAAGGSTTVTDAADPPAAGRRLGVGSVLLGSIRPAGDRLRLSVRLVSVKGGFDIWSEAYERPADDLIAVENEIVMAIVAALRLRGTGGDPADFAAVPQTSPAAHRAYLQGRSALRDESPGRAALAASQFSEAIRLDSTYAPAWAGLAESYVMRFVVESVAPLEVAPLARSAADRALALDSTLVGAWIARAVIRLLYERRLDEAGEDLARAIALDPNRAEGFHWQSHRLLAMGEMDSSLAASRRAIESSPFDASLRAHLGWHYLLARQDSLAVRAFGEAVAIDPAAAGTDEHFSWRPVRVDDPAAAYDSVTMASKTRYISPYTLAVAAAAAGRTAIAVSAVERAIDERTPTALYAGLDPRLDTLRSDRRFWTLLTRRGLTTIPTRKEFPVP